jgi:AraC-like DNA-binding protein
LLAGIALMVLLWYNQVWKISIVINLVTGFGYCLALYLIAYSLLQQGNSVAVAEDKPAVSRVKPAELEELMSKLISVMQQEKLYRDGDLNLPQLAGKMEVSVHEVSWVLNKGYNKNFYQFVNHYRVEAAKELLHKEEYNHLSILGIAFEAGFNSKTTFNTAFKKITGMSPREYRQLQVRTDTDGH